MEAIQERLEFSMRKSKTWTDKNKIQRSFTSIFKNNFRSTCSINYIRFCYL